MVAEPLFMIHYDPIVISISLATSYALDKARDAEKELCHAGYDVTNMDVFKGSVRDYVQSIGRRAWEEKFRSSLEVFGYYRTVDRFGTMFREVPGHDLMFDQYRDGLISLEEYVRALAVKLREFRK